MKGIESASITEAELDLLAASEDLVMIDLRGLPEGEEYRGAKTITMQDLVEEVVEQAVPSKDTTLVLICNQSFGMSRMVALSSYAYPTLKLMGYSDVRILRNHRGVF